jgi:hypothetical protein
MTSLVNTTSSSNFLHHLLNKEKLIEKFNNKFRNKKQSEFDNKIESESDTKIESESDNKIESESDNKIESESDKIDHDVEINKPQTSLNIEQTIISQPNQNLRSQSIVGIGELFRQTRDNSEIIASFTECINKWYRKIHIIDGDVPPNSMIYQNKMSGSSNSIKYYINNLNVIGEDYIKELIKYCKEVITPLDI